MSKPPTPADLQTILDRAKSSAAERQKLVESPEAVLEQAGLTATESAVNFLKSLGEVPFDPDAPATRRDPLGGDSGDM